MAGRSGAPAQAGGGGGGGAPAKKTSSAGSGLTAPTPARAAPGRAAAAAPEAQAPRCPLSTGLLDTRLIPWPGMRFACVRVLELYCKVFNQAELYELIIRKTCQSCKCPREAHDVYHEEWVNVCERLGFRTDLDQDGAERAGGLKGNPGARSTKERAQAEGYSWVPPGLASHKIAEYFSALPADKVPQLGGPGEKHRDRQLVSQLPKQDLALAYCRHVEKQHHASYEDFIHARNEIALDIGYVQDHASQDMDCPECGRTVAGHEVAVVAPKLGAAMRWHPACFSCSQCRELLVDLTYCVHDDALFCERHYAEQLKPRCASCDEGPGRTPSPPRPTDQLNGAGPPPRWLNNHAEEDTLGNGRGEASPTEESPRVPEIDAPTIVGDAGDDSARARPAIRTGDQNSKRRLSSSLDRPVTITSGDGGDVALLDPLADEPRRLSESFPELEDLPPPPKQLLRVEVDEPRRLSEIDADVPSPLPDPDADLPRRLSQPGEAPLLPPAGPTPAHTASPLPAPAPASARPPVPHPPSRRPRTSSGRTLSPADDEDRLRRISDFTDSEPSSPTRKGSNVDISWPIFHPAHAHPAHKSTLYRLEDVMSVDVEDDVFLPNPPKNPPGGNIIPVHHNLLEESQRMAQAEPKATEGRNINQQKSEQSKESTAPNSEQYKELTDFLKFLDDHIQEDDCMNLWQSIQHSDCRKPQIDSREPPAIENPSKQYLELQEFLKLNYGAGEGPAGPVQGEGPGEPLDESDAADIQKLVAPVLKSAPTDREYMDLLNFWFLLRAQEESPDEPLLEEYFTLKRQDEFKVVDDPSAAPVPANKFQEYEDLQRLLRALPPPPGPATDPHAAAPAPERSGAAARPSLLRPPGDDEPSSECADLPPKSPLHTELVTVSEEPQHLQRPARSHSFEEAPLSDLTENLIKAALEASAGRDDEGEDAEVAAITGRSEQGLEQDPVKDPRGEAGANGHGPAQRPEHASVAPAEAKSGDTAAPGTSGTSQPVHHASSSSQSDQQPEAFWLIFSGEYTKAMSKDWHAGHFCCWQCDESLTGQRYVLRDEHPYCIKCYESVFANTCEECSKTIGIDSKDLSYKDKHWHEACFLCSKCRVSLVDKQFGSKADHIYCGNCYDAQFASRCDGCGEIFRA
ncbi:hypothetical protein FOCC_FOCC017004, partial [Frankliniella occidentalis]